MATDKAKPPHKGGTTLIRPASIKIHPDLARTLASANGQNTTFMSIGLATVIEQVFRSNEFERQCKQRGIDLNYARPVIESALRNWGHARAFAAIGQAFAVASDPDRTAELELASQWRAELGKALDAIQTQAAPAAEQDT